jgi:2-keto-4-pentenoate hydratase
MSGNPEVIVAPVDVDALSRALAEAERTCTPIEPLTGIYPDLTTDDAYAIQRATVRTRLAEGALIRGHKIGLTAKVMQELFGINEPDYGHLLSDMFAFEGSELSLSEFISPRVEIEPAFVLGAPVKGPGLTVADIMRATLYIVPAIEIIDSRIRDWNIKLGDTIADNGSSKCVVLGGHPTRLVDLDLRDIDARLYVDGELVESGNTSAILGSPITAVAWLANKLGSQGVELEEGHVILPGTCIRAVSAVRPMRFVGTFEQLGSVEITFVAD